MIHKRVRRYTVCLHCRQPMSERPTLFCSGICQKLRLRHRVKTTGCMRCHEQHPVEGFATTGYCKPCNREMKRAAWKETPRAQRKAKQMRDAKHPERYKKYRRKIRTEVLAHYGDRCACCGESHEEFLSIDHIDGNGTAHRRLINQPIDRWLKKHNFPPGFRVLCMNCNFSLGKRGYCPHTTR